jgi:hypothetical protein
MPVGRQPNDRQSGRYDNVSPAGKRIVRVLKGGMGPIMFGWSYGGIALVCNWSGDTRAEKTLTLTLSRSTGRGNQKDKRKSPFDTNPNPVLP